MVYTDDWAGYDPIGKRYVHRRINHSAKVYMDGTTHTQTIEGFWGLFKSGVRGAHHSVSTRWLQGYLKRVDVAVQPARLGHADVPRPARGGYVPDGLGLLDGLDELPERVQHVLPLWHRDL